MRLVIISGGLGNQMFQYAFYLAMKKKMSNLKYDVSFYESLEMHNGFELKKIFKIDDLEMKRVYYKKNLFFKISKKILEEAGLFEIKRNIGGFLRNDLLNFSGLGIVYDGYWQSEKYFESITDEIKETYIFPKIQDLKNLELLNIIRNNNSVSIHVRRGDYLGHSELDGLAPLSYYTESIAYIKKRIKDPSFVIFSNDIEWCKENLRLDNELVEYVDWNKGDKSYIDMQLMSECKHNIIPNSSFSWWGAWLNKNKDKIVIAPEKWFNSIDRENYINLIPNEWIKIKNY